MNDSEIVCDEVVESCHEEVNFNEKKATFKTQNFYISLAFLLITITLLIAVSILFDKISRKTLFTISQRK